MSVRRGDVSVVGFALLAVAALELAAAGGVGAQTNPWQMGGGATYERYAFAESEQLGIESLSLVTTPFGASAWLGSRVRFEARGAFASGTLRDPSGAEQTLSGLTDTQVRASWAVVPDAVTVEVIGYLPTGTAELDAEEARVAGAVAADLLPFEIAQWGTGGAVAVAMTGARRFGDLGLGLTASYRASGSYEPFEDAGFTYEPGDELRLRVAVEYTVGRASRLSLAAGMRQFAEDVGNEQNLFQTGDRFELVGTYSFPAALRGAGAVYGALVSREGGTFLDRSDRGTPSQDLVLFGGLVRLPVGSHYVTPRLDGRVFSPETGTGQGYVVGVSASMDVKAGGTTWVPRLGARLGSLEATAETSTRVTGITAGLMVRFGPGGAGGR